MDYDKRLGSRGPGDGGVKMAGIIKLMLEAFDTLEKEHACMRTGGCHICKAHRTLQAGLEKLADEHDAEVLRNRKPSGL